MLNTQKENCGSAYVINLDRSTARWNKVAQELDKTGIKYQRFSAIDGYKIEFTDTTTGNKFTGQDLKNHKEIMKSNVKYQLTCNPDDVSPTQFDYQGKKLTAGEYGVWCSNMVIWEEAVKNGCDNTIIFEDDIIVKSRNFNQKLDKFIDALPSTYDIALIDIVNRGQIYSHPTNNYLKTFAENSWWWGMYAYIVSKSAAIKLTNVDIFSHEVDTFLAILTTGKNDPITMQTYGHEGLLAGKTDLLEGYVSAEKLVGIASEIASEIHEMGRDH
jgi:glycosyl transferase family 25